ncbi:ROK family protein [Microlunatus antarcticus]|uniref:Fructokinase n=1 Tax=Microlunatus antarcticus TaxID=53388 RepID=A0A7W5P809_9ACTN|nr:ROK family protein [Microlunatus antarcticus]MBB3327982.1 fructokinase [Microlunatus antarcticus]
MSTSPRAESRVLIGVDWGGTKIEAAALAPDGSELVRLRTPTPRSDYDACLATVVRLVAEVEAEVGTTGTIGVGLPGSLDPRTGVAKGCSSTWLIGRRPEDDLRTAFGRDIRTMNDADCFAASEAHDGAGAGHRVVFAVILGTGAGAGIAVDGRVHSGPNHSAGEWGHSALPYPHLSEVPGPACYCGRHGCLERWVSGRALARDYREHADIDLVDPAQLTAVDVVQRMRTGERLARMIFDRYLDRLARGLSQVVNALDPDVFVLGGGMSNVDELYAELPDRIASYTFSPCFYTPVVRAAHGDSSGVRGAAWLWR